MEVSENIDFDLRRNSCNAALNDSSLFQGKIAGAYQLIRRINNDVWIRIVQAIAAPIKTGSIIAFQRRPCIENISAGVSPMISYFPLSSATPKPLGVVAIG